MTTPSELMVENRQLKKQLAATEQLHAYAIEGWKDEMGRVMELESVLRRMADISDMLDNDEKTKMYDPGCKIWARNIAEQARAALDNRREG